jgi:hypothetical protein
MNLGDILKNILKFAFSWGGHKMNDDVKKLQDTINSIITRPDRQPGYHGTTWCIVAAWEILKILGDSLGDLATKPDQGQIPRALGHFIRRGVENPGAVCPLID